MDIKSTQPPVNPAFDPSVTPFCGDLRSKKFFMLDVLPTEAHQFLDESGYCWCFHTQQIIGPDGLQAHPDDCSPGRSCYRSALSMP